MNLKHFWKNQFKSNEKCMLLVFLIPKKNILFFIVLRKTNVMNFKKSGNNLYIDQRNCPKSWNNIFQQKFGPDMQAEKCFEIIATSICPFSFNALYLKLSRKLEKKPQFFEKEGNLNSEHLWKNNSKSNENICYWNFQFPGVNLFLLYFAIFF